jgi:mRNA-degrading endonuclease RelE of RelBE toxin-antitoxin system
MPVTIDTNVNACQYGTMEVMVTGSALEEYSRLPRPIQSRVLQLVGRLDRWPNVSGAKPLSGKLAGHFRLRT